MPVHLYCFFRYPPVDGEHKLPLSCDPNALKLANHTSPDVIIGIKALQTIFANFANNLNEEWTIPFTAIKLNNDKLALVLDSPIIKASAKTPLEKYQMFLRKATKYLLVKAWNEEVVDTAEILETATPIQAQAKRSSNDFKDDIFDSSKDFDISALETFGQGAQLDGNDTDDGSADENLVIDEALDQESSPTKTVTTRKRVTRSSAAAQSDSSEHELEQEVKGVPLKKRPFASPAALPPPKSDNDSFLSNIMASQKSLSKSRENATHAAAGGKAIPAYHGEPIFLASYGNAQTDYLSPKATTGCNEIKNVHYRRWILRPKENIKDSLTLLVKGSTHGLGITDQQPLTISSKIEGQLPFGLEQLSRTEMAHDWLATMLRPNSCLVRPRVSVEDQNVLHVDFKSLKELTQDGLEADQSFSPAYSLGNIYTLLSNLKEQINEPGQYLLRHDAKTGPFVKVMMSTDQDHSGKSYDLHANYLTIHAAQDLKMMASFRPLDVNTITPLHFFNGRVPGLFAPPVRSDQVRMSPGTERGGRSGRGRGGRGRGRSRGRGRGRNRGK